MAFHVPNKYRLRSGPLASDDSVGNNGAFLIQTKLKGFKEIRIMASDGGGWEHVSVSTGVNHGPPPWHIMCLIKDIFWDEEDCVVQYHPPKEDYVNLHKGCLHLWRPTYTEMPRPESWMVGPGGDK